MSMLREHPTKSHSGFLRWLTTRFDAPEGCTSDEDIHCIQNNYKYEHITRINKLLHGKKDIEFIVYKTINFCMVHLKNIQGC